MMYYYNTWGGSVNQFWDMLSKKAYYSATTNEDIFIAGKMRTPQEAEQILVLADDMIQAGELR